MAVNQTHLFDAVFRGRFELVLFYLRKIRRRYAQPPRHVAERHILFHSQRPQRLAKSLSCKFAYHILSRLPGTLPLRLCFAV